MKKVLIVYAVQDEFVPITIKGYEVQYIVTGIGKANAAMKLTKEIMIDLPDLVLNIGTVGTIDYNIGDILICRTFVDRDLLPLVDYGVTAKVDLSDNIQIEKLLKEWEITDRKIVTCNTGDTFVSDLSIDIDGDIIDMESFALAMVCKEFDVPFLSLKYVTDIVGQNSIKHWEDKLADSRIAITHWFEDK